MKRIDRRTFMLVASVGGSGAVLTACGNTESTDANLSPTMIPDVAGAPPTLAPQATPGGGAQAPEEPVAAAPAAEEAPAEGAPAASGGAGEPIAVEAQDPYAWSIYEFDAAPGQIIQATNAGFLEHNFAVDEWGIEEDLPPGDPVEITVPEDAEVGASFIYYCSVPGHREGGMEGTLTIIEAGAAPAAEEAPPAAESGQAPSGGAGEPIAVEAQDPYAWSVYEMDAAPGQVIQATNAGFLEHNFAVDEWGIEEDLPPGEPVDIMVPEDAEVGAAFVYYCSVPGHREGGMEGTLTIVEAGALPAAAASGQGSPPPAEQAPASPEAAPAAAATPDAAVTAPAPATPVAPPAVATPAPGTIALYAEDPSVWNPNALTVSAGDTLSIVNTGVLQHDFTVDEWSISQYLPNGGLVEIEVPADAQPGQTFTFYCSEHREQGMEGTLTIR